MSTSRPEADTEYSRGHEPSRGLRRPSKRRRREGGGGVATAVLALGLAAAVLLAVAEFTPLLRVRSTAYDAGIIQTIGTGSHHGWALIPLAVLAALLVLLNAGARGANRLAPAALIGLGLVVLGIALLRDLPDAHTSGLILRGGSAPTQASSKPAIGLYLETLGGVLLLLAGGAGLLLDPRPGRRRGRGRPDGLPEPRQSAS